MCYWFLQPNACMSDYCDWCSMVQIFCDCLFSEWETGHCCFLLPFSRCNSLHSVVLVKTRLLISHIIFSLLASLSPSFHSIQSPSPPQTQVTYWHPFASHIDFHDVILCVSYFRISSLCRSYSLYCPLFSFSAPTGHVIDFVIVLMYPWFLKNNHIWPIIETSPSMADICGGMHMLRVSVRDMDTTDFRSTPSRTQFRQFTASN